jgi:hypothetical protein
MKQFSVGFLLLAFVLSAAAPLSAYAKNGSDDKDDDVRIELKSGLRLGNSHNSNKDLEVEAKVYTDVTIIKVELENEGRKTVFESTADTKAEVIDAVVAKFNLDEDDVEAALEFEVKDRASRVSERAKISFKNNRPVVKPIEVCDDSASSALEVEATVFTDKTVVKVELVNGTKKAFETSATTTAGITAAIVAKVTTLTTAEVEAVLDIDIEDRASKDSDFDFPSDSDDDCDENKASTTVKTNAKLEARIAELKVMIEALIKLLNARLGN